LLPLGQLGVQARLFRTKADGYCELNGERVPALTNFSARGRTSGLQVGRLRAKGARQFHVRGGKVTRLVLYVVGPSELHLKGLRSSLFPWPSP
jgi:hypothetical protein